MAFESLLTGHHPVEKHETRLPKTHALPAGHTQTACIGVKRAYNPIRVRCTSGSVHQG